MDEVWVVHWLCVESHAYLHIPHVAVTCHKLFQLVALSTKTFAMALKCLPQCQSHLSSWFMEELKAMKQQRRKLESIWKPIPSEENFWEMPSQLQLQKECTISNESMRPLINSALSDGLWPHWIWMVERALIGWWYNMQCICSPL